MITDTKTDSHKITRVWVVKSIFGDVSFSQVTEEVTFQTEGTEVVVTSVKLVKKPTKSN